jgi:maltose alpha-D-glucosyltransferase / alpha-amylase
MSRRRSLPGRMGKLMASPTSSFRRVRGPAGKNLDPSPMQAEQSNTSVVYGDRLVLKLFRRLDPGVNPDLEIGRFLTERVEFPHIPQVAGALEYLAGRHPMTMGILHGFVPNEGDAWSFTLDSLGSYLEQVLVRQREVEYPPLPRRPILLDLSAMEAPSLAHELFGAYLESARLLGRRTGELHLALGSDTSLPEFAPEPFTSHYQQSLYQSMRALTRQVFRLIEARRRHIPQVVQIIDMESEIVRRFRAVADTKLEAMRIRVHGDYHLGQVLFTGKDFVILDFEGEPARPLGERRIKRTPLKDVAGMIRSFHYAAYTALFGQTLGAVRAENPAFLEPWILFWYIWVTAAFLRAYLDTAGDSGLLPKGRRELECLLDALVLEKAVYELRYEINNRPEWVKIPIEGILQLVEARD